MNFFNLDRQFKLIKRGLLKNFEINFKKGDFIQGKNVKILEKKLLTYSDSKYCLSCGNGTDAIRIAIKALKIPKNSHIIVPSYTWISTASSVVESDMVPIFCDVDENSFLMSVEKIKETLKHAKENKVNVKAIITVDLFGNPVEYNKIYKLCKSKNIFFISDAAQSFGAKQFGNYIGSRSCDVMTTSFFPTKNIGGYGDGGALFFNNKYTYNTAKIYAKNGQKVSGEIVSSGINSRLDTMQASVLLEKLKLLSKETVLKKKIFLLYKKLLNKNYFEFQKINKNYQSSFSVMTLKINKNIKRNLLTKFLEKERIPYKVYYENSIHKSRFYKTYPMVKMDITEKLSRTTISLPIFPYLKNNEVKKICNKINFFFNS